MLEYLIKYGNVIEGLFGVAIGLCFAAALLRPKGRPGGQND